MVVSKVKQVMEERGATLRGMATKSGLSDATILRARRNILECRLSTLQTIADCLECGIKDLFDEEKQKPTKS
jgi:DNA-binding Xre family transcriptional regulator